MHAQFTCDERVSVVTLEHTNTHQCANGSAHVFSARLLFLFFNFYGNVSAWRTLHALVNTYTYLLCCSFLTVFRSLYPYPLSLSLSSIRSLSLFMCHKWIADWEICAIGAQFHLTMNGFLELDLMLRLQWRVYFSKEIWDWLDSHAIERNTTEKKKKTEWVEKQNVIHSVLLRFLRIYVCSQIFIIVWYWSSQEFIQYMVHSCEINMWFCCATGMCNAAIELRSAGRNARIKVSFSVCCYFRPRKQEFISIFRWDTSHGMHFTFVIANFYRKDKLYTEFVEWVVAWRELRIYARKQKCIFRSK